VFNGGNYDLFLQSLSGFLIIALIFVPFLRWAFTSKSDREHRQKQRELKRDLRKLRRK
jgi:large-conductance mechanosensitive channel